jgi:hypothetical protein
MNRIQFRGPSLFGISVGALTRLLQRLFMALLQTAQVGVQLGLKFGANGVNDAANLFLGHYFALSGPGSGKSSIENPATLSRRAT